MSSFKDHCLDKGKLSNGVKLPLLDHTGKVSGDYIMVRWAWADEVRAATDAFKRELAERLIVITDGMTAKQKKDNIAKNAKVTAELSLDAIVSEVAGWSFDEKPTKANVKAYLLSRPDVAERVDVIAAKTNLFFTQSGASS